MLALAAITLVIVAPMISRALAPTVGAPLQAPALHATHDIAPAPKAAAAVHPVHHEMGHGMDHAMMMMPESTQTAASNAQPSTPADPHAEHEMGVDCDYCLIAARMISLLVALLLLLANTPASFRDLPGFAGTRRAPAPGTLGARGPPAAAF